jgi:PKD repeat protein
LTVTDALGVQVSVSKQVTVVKSAIQANFTLTVQGLKVSVDGSLSVGTITKYSYNFGPATKSGATTTNTYTYSTAGNYTITLTVTDSTGSTSSYSQTAYLSNPTSSFIASSSQGTASFDASASTDLYPISKYAWSFGDGTTGSGKTPKHVYAAAGTYTVALTVTDTFNNSASTSKTVTITIAAAKCSIACVTNYMQVFCYYNGTLQNQLSNYVWNWGDGTTSNDILLATHTYNVAGTLTVNLTVNYIGSTLSCTAKPVIKTTSLVYPVPAWYGGQSGLTLSINFYGWTTNGKSINSVSWNFGDGTTSTVTSPTHTYATSGIYAVVCTVVDSAGVSATAVQVYNFTSLPVSVSVGAMTKYTVGYPIQFAYTDVLVVDNLGNPVGNVQVQSSLQSQGANLYQSPVATTDATGWTTLKSTSGAANLVFSICVNNLVYSGPAPSLWYNQSGNKAQCL